MIIYFLFCRAATKKGMIHQPPPSPSFGEGGEKHKGRVMFKGMGDMLKQASQMKEKMAEMQEMLAKQQVEASTGGGMVKVTANGNNEILHVHIDEELINMKDRAILEDLVAGAMNEVHRKVKDLAQAEMTKLTGGIKIPGLFP